MIRTDGIPDSLLNLSMGTNLFTMPAFLRAVDNSGTTRTCTARACRTGSPKPGSTSPAVFKDDPAVIGYDLFNEPWPGTAWPTCLPPAGCKDFDTKKLAPFMAKLTAAVQSVDPATWPSTSRTCSPRSAPRSTWARPATGCPSTATAPTSVRTARPR